MVNHPNPQAGVNPAQAYDIYDNPNRQIPSLDVTIEESLRVAIHTTAQQMKTLAEHNARVFNNVMELLTAPLDTKLMEVPSGETGFWEPDTSRKLWVFESVTLFPLNGVNMPDTVWLGGLRQSEIPLSMTAGTEQKIGIPITNKPRIALRVVSTTARGVFAILRTKAIPKGDRSPFGLNE